MKTVSRPSFSALCLLALLPASLWAADDHAPAAAPAKKVTAEAIQKGAAADISTTSAANAKEVGDQVREALGTKVAPNKALHVVVAGKPGVAASTRPATPPAASSQYERARAKAHGIELPKAMEKETVVHAAEAHWAYEGDTGPQAWGKLKPDFNVCAIGKRQSPIHIEDGATLQGPAEAIQFSYAPSGASVVNNGHTIQVDVQGENNIIVRGSSYKLLQFHFHTPSEEQINFKRYPMVAHLVHRNAEGQLAVVAVLLEQGTAHAAIDKVWTYMPLDTGDRVRMPQESLNLAELLPKDQRYYQFMGSLTTPPCSEGVLWLVMKTPVQISKAQLRLFQQLYPNNARPVQPLNGRPVREAL